jgi:cytochrome c553
MIFSALKEGEPERSPVWRGTAMETRKLVVVAALGVSVVGMWMKNTIAQEAAPAPAPPATAPASAPATTQAATRPSVSAANPVEAGKYIVQIAGCHDCHTPGWMETGGAGVAEEKYLTGLHVGFRGPWGTTYGANLRAFAKTFVEDDFVKVLRSRTSRPPMPWSAIHAMSDADLRAVFKYLRSLEPTGAAAPAFVPPGVEPKTPYFVFDPGVAPGAYGAATKPATTAPAPTTAPVKP